MSVKYEWLMNNCATGFSIQVNKMFVGKAHGCQRDASRLSNNVSETVELKSLPPLYRALRWETSTPPPHTFTNTFFFIISHSTIKGGGEAANQCSFVERLLGMCRTHTQEAPLKHCCLKLVKQKKVWWIIIVHHQLDTKIIIKTIPVIENTTVSNEKENYINNNIVEANEADQIRSLAHCGADLIQLHASVLELQFVHHQCWTGSTETHMHTHVHAHAH